MDAITSIPEVESPSTKTKSKSKSKSPQRRATCHTKEHFAKLLQRKLQRQVIKFEEKLTIIRGELAKLPVDDQEEELLDGPCATVPEGDLPSKK